MKTLSKEQLKQALIGYQATEDEFDMNTEIDRLVDGESVIFGEMPSFAIREYAQNLLGDFDSDDFDDIDDEDSDVISHFVKEIEQCQKRIIEKYANEHDFNIVERYENFSQRLYLEPK